MLLSAAARGQAQTQGQFQTGISVGGSPPTQAQPTSAAPLPAAPEIFSAQQMALTNQPLELEVFVNNRPTNLIASFTRHTDGRIFSSPGELKAIGLKSPATTQAMPAANAVDADQQQIVPLDSLPGVTYDYDEQNQLIRIFAKPAAQQPVLINAAASLEVPQPTRPPWGTTLDYSIFGSAYDGPGGPRFQGVSGEFNNRVFGPYGVAENSFIGRTTAGRDLVRLDSFYRYEDPDGLMTGIAGDMISGGFSWTRPIRMLGFQLRRDFAMRPDLITLPLPSINGTAAAPSMLDLYINQVRTLSTDVPEGPYSIANPPIIYGSGQAQVVLRDALGRETISSSDFYASPQLLAPGLDDFSFEGGFARRNYAVLSNDYDNLLAFSGSYRKGITSWLTLQSHAETAGDFMEGGGGGIFTVGDFGLASVALSGSRASGQQGGLVDMAFESRTPDFSITLRAQHTFGIYQDLASWTAASAPTTISALRIFGNPLELEQVAVSLPLPWSGSSFGVSAVQLRQPNNDQSRIANLSFTQQFGRLTLFASYARDFNTAGSSALFAGISIPLNGDISASGGTTSRRGQLSAYAEASKQDAQAPGSFGWAVRGTEGDSEQVQGIARYGTNFANLEATGLYRDGAASATGLVEGAVTVAQGHVYASPPLTSSFAIVDAGVPGVTVMRENRVVGVTGEDGALLVQNLSAFTANKIAIDPASLPVDAAIANTEAKVTPFRRVPGLVNLGVNTDVHAALVTFDDSQGRPLELGSQVQVAGVSSEVLIGYDGQAYMEGLKDQNVVIVTMPDGRPCRATFAYVPSPGKQVRIGPVACAPNI
jgi:outer membrane usher protein